MLHFVLPASLTMSIFGLLVFAGFLAVGVQESLLANPFLNSRGVLQQALPQAQTALAEFSILCGLLLIVFVEPPGKFWVGGDEYSGDRRPTFLALGLTVIFVVFLVVPSLGGFFDFVPLSGLAYLALAGAVVLWALLLRWAWRSKLVERFFGLNLES